MTFRTIPLRLLSYSGLTRKGMKMLLNKNSLKLLIHFRMVINLPAFVNPILLRILMHHTMMLMTSKLL